MLLSRCLLLGALAAPAAPTSSPVPTSTPAAPASATARTTPPAAPTSATARAATPAAPAGSPVPASTPAAPASATARTTSPAAPASPSARTTSAAAVSLALSRAASAPTPIGAAAGFTLRPAAPAAASSPNSRDAVAAGLDEAERLYLEGRALEAIDRLHRLFHASGEPVCLANIGRLYDERAQPDLAAEYYRKFLLHPRSAPEHRALIRSRLLALTPEPASTLPPLRQEGPTPAPAGSLPAPRTRADTLITASASLGGLSVLNLAAGFGLVTTAQTRLSALDHAVLDVAAERERSVREALTRRAAGVGLLVVGGVALVASLTTAALGLRRGDRRRVRLAGLQLRF